MNIVNRLKLASIKQKLIIDTKIRIKDLAVKFKNSFFSIVHTNLVLVYMNAKTKAVHELKSSVSISGIKNIYEILDEHSLKTTTTLNSIKNIDIKNISSLEFISFLTKNVDISSKSYSAIEIISSSSMSIKMLLKKMTSSLSSMCIATLVRLRLVLELIDQDQTIGELDNIYTNIGEMLYIEI